MPTASQLKRAAHKAKFRAVAEELATLQAETDFYEHNFRADYEYAFQPQAVDDPQVSSRLGGPQMKTVQWEPKK